MFTYSSEIKQSFIFKEGVTRVKEKKPTKFYIRKQFVKEMWNNSELEHLHTVMYIQEIIFCIRDCIYRYSGNFIWQFFPFSSVFA